MSERYCIPYCYTLVLNLAGVPWHFHQVLAFPVGLVAVVTGERTSIRAVSHSPCAGDPGDRGIPRAAGPGMF